MTNQFNIDQWLELLVGKLKNTFAERIVFIGHTGSYVRGEATEESDIDLNIILDMVLPEDKLKYRELLADMPFKEKACGFIAGKEEILAWPRHELFHFLSGCRILHGSLSGILKEATDEEIREYIRISASSILHFARHTFIYYPDLSEGTLMLRDCYKSSFFILQAHYKIHEHEFVLRRNELVNLLSTEVSREVLTTAINWSASRENIQENPAYYFDLLEKWSSEMMVSCNKS